MDFIHDFDKLEFDAVNTVNTNLNDHGLGFFKEEGPVSKPTAPEENKTPRKIRQFSLGCPYKYEKTAKDINNSNNNENVLTKVSSFGQKGNKLIENGPVNQEAITEKGELD